MKKVLLCTLLTATATLAAFNGHAATIDLSSWTQEGDGNWILQTGNDTVLQTVNGQPTVFHSGTNSQGQSLSGEITVTTTSDDDFIGFVLGYNAGDLTNEDADYLLIDWKQANQSFSNWGTATEGLAISRVTDELFNLNAWDHEAALGVEELQRATNLGSSGWDDNTTYSFDLIFTSSLVQVFVNDVLEISVTGSFSDGAFGFYNFSQPNVLYAGITSDVVEPPANVSAPATLGITLLGLLGLLARRVSKK